MQKLLKTLLSLLIMTPAAALALGLGNVTLHSALNQPLDAEIELLSVASGEIESLQVGLADAQTFARIGVERSGNLMMLRFDVQQKPSGKYVVKVTTRENMREPFTTFLLDARWNAGRIVREYTLLLDPPITHTERAAPPVVPIAAPAAPAPAPAAPATAVTAPATVDMTPPPGVISTPAEPAADPGRVAVEPTPAAPTREAPRPAPVSSELVYGPVKANDTLWRIAQQMRPSNDISIQQMMMALLKANPQAFIDGNINRLKSGYVLRIDDPALLRAMTQAEAVREVSRQTRAWEAHRQAVAARAAERVTPPTERVEPAAAAAPRTEPELKLVTPEGKADSPVASGDDITDETVAAVRRDLMLALESSAAQREENQELQKRIAAMESQLADMERMLQLKNTDLATLQQQLREQGQEVELSSEAPLAAAPEVEETVAVEEPVAEETAPVAEESAPVVEEVAPAIEEVESAPQAAAAEPRAERPRRATPPPAPPQPTLMESLMADKAMLGIGAGVFVVLLLILWLFVKNRRKSSFQESILAGATSSMLGSKEGEASETSFLSDLAISGMGPGVPQGEEGEVDPITEAEVFMAYGRYNQAEDVLKKALEEQPERKDLTAKLAETYYHMGNASSFAALVVPAAALLKQNQAQWDSLVAMGHELMPEHELFATAGGSAPVVQGAKPAGPASDDVLDIGLDLDALTAEMEGGASTGGEELLDLDLDLDLGSESAETTKAGDFDMDFGAELEETTRVEDFDMDFGGGSEEASAADEFSLDTAEEEYDPLLTHFSQAQPEPAAEEDFTLDFDLGSEEAAPESDTFAQEPETSEFADFDLGELDMGESEIATEAEEVDSVLGQWDSISEAEQMSGSDELDDLDLSEGMLEEGDEITTKLDLAQAYIEMGDAEGARSMLEEVIQAGNDEQQRQAQDLISKI